MAPRSDTAVTPTHIGRYEVIERIGQGGMGSVYLAKDPAIGRRVAIKLLKEEFDDDLRQRFEREARSVGQIEHGNIVTIYDVGVHDGRPYIAMSYIAGETLAQLIRRKEPMPLVRRLLILEAVCAGLHAAHNVGIVHRDMKPANVMVDAQGVVKILDFGIARLASEGTQKTQDGTIMGTYNYMSPEQIAGKPLDCRSDIFAVGAIFYEVLSYTRAFSGSLRDGLWYRLVHEPPQPLRDLCRDLDADVERIVMRALEKEASKRYADLDAMRREVAKVRRRVTAAEVASLIEAARRAFDANDFDKALTDAHAAMALDPDDSQAIELADRTKTAIDEQLDRQRADAERQMEHERHAREVVATANRHVALRDSRGAMAALTAFSPPHPLVTARIDELLHDVSDRLANVRRLFEGGHYGEALKTVDAVLAQITEGPSALRTEVETLRDRTEDAFTARVLELERERTAADDSADTDRVRHEPAHANGIVEPSRHEPPVGADNDDDDDSPTQVIERPRPPLPQNSPQRMNIVFAIVVAIVLLMLALLTIRS